MSDAFDLDELSDYVTALLGEEHTWTPEQITWVRWQWAIGASYSEIAQWVSDSMEKPA